jgi:hypothetical protein
MTKMENIRKSWPKPVRMNDAARDRNFHFPNYCVGGAICRYIGMPTYDNFPKILEIAEALKYINPRLPDKDAYNLANSIVMFNDQGDFEGAWEVVKKAFEFDKD